MSVATEVTALNVAFDDYPHTLPLKRGEIKSPHLALAFSDIKPANRFFKPMVRELKFDVSEMAIATFVQAKAYGKPLVLLPATMMGRFQQGTHPVPRGKSDHAGRSRRQAGRRALLQPDHGGLGARHPAERLRRRRQSRSIG